MVPAKTDAHDLDLGPVRLTAVGVEFLRAPTYEEWANAFSLVKRCEGAVAWWTGDMINAGDNMFGEQASQEFEKETLRKFAWVSEKVTPAVRRRTLSFTHHEKVARLEPREQKHWLQRAETEGWSAKELAKKIKGADVEQEDDGKEPCPICGRMWDGVYKL